MQPLSVHSWRKSYTKRDYGWSYAMGLMTKGSSAQLVPLGLKLRNYEQSEGRGRWLGGGANLALR